MRDDDYTPGETLLDEAWLLNQKAARRAFNHQNKLQSVMAPMTASDYHREKFFSGFMPSGGLPEKKREPGHETRHKERHS